MVDKFYLKQMKDLYKFIKTEPNTSAQRQMLK